MVAIFRMRNLYSLSDSKQVCLVPNPNSQSSVILGRSFSVTRNGLCVTVLLNTLDTTVSIQRGKKLGYALPMRTDYEETQNLKKHSVKDCPFHANKDKILKRITELKSIHKLFAMKSETDDGLSGKNGGKNLGRSTWEEWLKRHGVRPDPEAVLTWKAPRTPEFPRVCQLLPGIHKRICGQGVSDAEADAQQGEKVRMER